MRKAFTAFLALVALALCAPAVWAAEGKPKELVADLSEHVISITTGFTGSDLLAFGATQGEGDVILVISGPRNDITLRRKEQVAGIWVNGAGMVFQNVPSFYAVLSNKPVRDILDPEEARRHQIGFDSLAIPPKDSGAPADKVASYRDGLIRLKQDQGLYVQAEAIRFDQSRLFRANIHFPAAVPVGTFEATIYLVKDRKVVSQESTPLAVTKVGMGAQVFYFANEYAAAYGVVAIIVAVIAGWLAGVIFRKKV